MRTTVRLNEQLMKDSKRFAAKTGRTLTSLLEEGLQQVLKSKKRTKPKRVIRLKTFKGNGLHPGVDLDHAAALLDLMESHQ